MGKFILEKHIKLFRKDLKNIVLIVKKNDVKKDLYMKHLINMVSTISVLN